MQLSRGQRFSAAFTAATPHIAEGSTKLVSAVPDAIQHGSALVKTAAKQQASTSTTAGNTAKVGRIQKVTTVAKGYRQSGDFREALGRVDVGIQHVRNGIQAGQAAYRGQKVPTFDKPVARIGKGGVFDTGKAVTQLARGKPGQALGTLMGFKSTPPSTSGSGAKKGSGGTTAPAPAAPAAPAAQGATPPAAPAAQPAPAPAAQPAPAAPAAPAPAAAAPKPKGLVKSPYYQAKAAYTGARTITQGKLGSVLPNMQAARGGTKVGELLGKSKTGFRAQFADGLRGARGALKEA